MKLITKHFTTMDTVKKVIDFAVYAMRNIKKKNLASIEVNTFIQRASPYQSLKFLDVIFVQIKRLLRVLTNTASVYYKNNWRK